MTTFSEVSASNTNDRHKLLERAQTAHAAGNELSALRGATQFLSSSAEHTRGAMFVAKCSHLPEGALLRNELAVLARPIEAGAIRRNRVEASGKGKGVDRPAPIQKMGDTAKGLEALSHARNEETLTAESLESIPAANFFASEDDYVFDIAELRKTVIEMRALKNPYTGFPFSTADCQKIARHASGLGNGLLQFAGEPPCLPPLRPELLGTIQRYLDDRLGRCYLIPDLRTLCNDLDDLLALPVTLRSADGEVIFNAPFEQLLTGFPRDSVSNDRHLQRFTAELFNTSIAAVRAGTFREAKANLFRSERFFTEKKWLAEYLAVSQNRTYGVPGAAAPTSTGSKPGLGTKK